MVQPVMCDDCTVLFGEHPETCPVCGSTSFTSVGNQNTVEELKTLFREEVVDRAVTGYKRMRSS